MEDIYWTVFGDKHRINNEVPLWIVHGYIAQTKSIAINWAKAVESTAWEKACRDDAKSGQGVIVKKKKTEIARYIGGSMGPIEDLIQSSLQLMNQDLECQIYGWLIMDRTLK
jgi:hypothetical protein